MRVNYSVKVEVIRRLPMTQHVRFLELSRSSVYYRPVGVSNEDLRLIKAIDEIHLEQPFKGLKDTG